MMVVGGTPTRRGLWVRSIAHYAPQAVTHPCWQPMLLELLATSSGTANTQASASRRPSTCSGVEGIIEPGGAEVG